LRVLLQHEPSHEWQTQQAAGMAEVIGGMNLS